MVISSLVTLANTSCANLTTPRKDDGTVQRVLKEGMRQLPQDVANGYRCLSRGWHHSENFVLGHLPEDLIRRREYSATETAGALTGLWRVANSPRAFEAIARAATKEFPGANADSVFVFVDPTCSTCQHVLQVAREFERAHADTGVFYLPRPDDDDLSRYAAAALKFTAMKADRKTYVEVLLKLSETLPRDNAEIDSIVGDTLDLATTVNRMPQYDRAQGLVNAWIDRLKPIRGGPFVLFHGRMLDRNVAARISFDPLQNGTTLETTVRLIRRIDSEKEKCR